MNEKEIIEKTEAYVKCRLVNIESGHDWFHVQRVLKTAKTISKDEKADIFVVEMASLLHDISDYKFGDAKEDLKNIKSLLESFGLDKKRICSITEIVENISFKGNGEKETMKTIEGKIVQDADRLDALGAIGIARCFSFAGHRKNPFYDPNISPKKNMTFGDYKKMKSPAVSHFYEKLFLLKDRMNTKTARKIAEKRHKFMKIYLDMFFKEFEGKD